MSGEAIKLSFDIGKNDLSSAGEASSSVKKILSQLGVNPQTIKKAAVAMYEAEINAVIHASGGMAEIEIDKEKIVITITDKGPGIEDINLAMQEGYSTATDRIRAMGFGAGMGLPNMKRYADDLDIQTVVGEGTKVQITVLLDNN